MTTNKESKPKFYTPTVPFMKISSRTISFKGKVSVAEPEPELEEL
jgi:hypothetical protein